MTVDVDVDGSVFAFPTGTIVEKVDEWSEHAQLTSAPFNAKACDVVALLDGVVWLIEAKDYSYDGASVPGDLADVVAAKVHGSLALLHAVSRWRTGERADFSRRVLALEEARVCLSIDLPVRGRGLRPEQLSLLAGLKDNLRRSCRRLGMVRIVVSGWEQQANVPWSVTRSPGTRSLHLPM